MALNRFHRRTVAKIFFEFLEIYNDQKQKTDAFRYFELDEYGIVFFYYSPDYIYSYFPDYGLQTAMIGNAINQNFPKKRMLGIGVTSDMEELKFKFVDLNYPLEDEIIEQTQVAIQSLGWFKDLNFKKYNDSNYPKANN